MSKKLIIIIITILILIIGVIVGYTYLNPKNNTDDIIIDENGVEYSSNTIVVFFYSNVSKLTCEQIVKEIDGNAISFSSISVQIKLNNRKFNSYDEILQYCQQIKNQYEEVKYAMPVMITETTVN